eukprot:503523-Hanusia_phi.AAC.2
MFTRHLSSCQCRGKLHEQLKLAAGEEARAPKAAGKQVSLLNGEGSDSSLVQQPLLHPDPLRLLLQPLARATHVHVHVPPVVRLADDADEASGSEEAHEFGSGLVVLGILTEDQTPLAMLRVHARTPSPSSTPAHVTSLLADDSSWSSSLAARRRQVLSCSCPSLVP